MNEPEYVKLSEYRSRMHRGVIRLVRLWMHDAGISSVELVNGELRLNYVVGVSDIIANTEFTKLGEVRNNETIHR